MAAKTIQVSNDGGVTWYTLPGGTGEYSEEAGQIDDTIFGAAYQSNEAGIISWTINANALYKGFAGYFAKVKQPGTSTAFTGEAMSLVSGQTYQINNAAMQIWDRTATFVVYDNGTDVTNQVVEFDYLFGKITFDSGYTVVGSITIDGAYFPMVDLGTASSFTLAQTADAIQTTDFATAQSNGGYHTYNPGLKTVSLELTGFYSASNNFSQLLNNRQEVIIEINPDGSGKSLARGYFRAITHGQSGDVGALEEETISFSLNVPADDKIKNVYSWYHDTTTTLSQAVRIILDAWEQDTKPMVQYLYNGTNGYRGTAVVTDVSLESSLEGMNTFAANFQGDGAVTIV